MANSREVSDEESASSSSDGSTTSTAPYEDHSSTDSDNDEVKVTYPPVEVTYPHNYFPAELWVSFANADLSTYWVLSQVSKHMLALVSSDASWASRTKEDFTASPRRKKDETHRNYYQRTFGKLNGYKRSLKKFNLGELGKNTEANVKEKIELLEESIKAGLEQFARRLIDTLPPDAFSKKNLKRLLNTHFIDSKHNPQIVFLLYSLLNSAKDEMRPALIEAGYLFPKSTKRNCHHITDSRNLAPLWGVLTLPQQQAFFLNPTRTRFIDRLSGDFRSQLDQTPETKQQIYNLLLMFQLCITYSDVQFILHSTSALRDYHDTINAAFYFALLRIATCAPHSANSLKLLIAAHAEAERESLCKLATQVALTVYTNGTAALFDLHHFPRNVATIATQLDSIKKKRVIAAALYCAALVQPITQLEDVFATLRPHISDEDVDFILNKTIRLAIAGHPSDATMSQEIILFLLKQIPAEKLVAFASAIFEHTLNRKYPITGLAHFIDCLQILGPRLSMPLYEQVLESVTKMAFHRKLAVPKENADCHGYMSPSLTLSQFEKMVARQPSPWLPAMVNVLQARLTEGFEASNEKFYGDLVSHPLVLEAVTFIFRRAEGNNDTDTIQRLLDTLPKKTLDRALVPSFYNSMRNRNTLKEVKTTFLKYLFEHRFADLLYALAEYATNKGDAVWILQWLFRSTEFGECSVAEIAEALLLAQSHSTAQTILLEALSYFLITSSMAIVVLEHHLSTDAITQYRLFSLVQRLSDPELSLVIHETIYRLVDAKKPKAGGINELLLFYRHTPHFSGSRLLKMTAKILTMMLHPTWQLAKLNSSWIILSIAIASLC